MKDLVSKSPPKWMDKILSFYCKKDVLEDLQGDLHEFFNRNIADKGILRAKFIYLIDVLKFIRLYTVKTPKFFRKMNYLAIFKNGFKTSLRSLIGNKLFTSINVFGLAISMSIGLLLITLYVELDGFDQFHEKKDRIYRVINSLDDGEEEISNYASTSILTGDKIREEFTGVEKVVTISGRYSMDAHYKESVIPLQGKWVTPEFGEVFNFEILHGNIVESLKKPNFLVITRETALRLFDRVDVVNEIIENRKGELFTIGGVIENVPNQSHLEFEVLCSFVTYELKYKKRGIMGWRNMWSHHVYVLLSEDASVDNFQKQLDNLAIWGNKTIDDEITLKAQSLNNIVPGPDLYNEVGKSFDQKQLMILMLLGLVILISACFNYTNLSVARSLRRCKEVGIRKTIGASRFQVFFQFLLEAIIVSILAMFISIFFFYLIRPFFIGTLGYSGEMLKMVLTIKVILYFLLFSIIVGIAVGFFPSYVMSSMKVKAVLRDVASIKLFTTISLRKALIVLQFSLSMIFIISVIISFRQYEYALNRDLGYQTENVLNVKIQDNDVKILASEFDKLPAIEEYSFSLMIPSVGSIYTDYVINRNVKDSTEIPYNIVSPNYLSLYDHELIAGNNFGDIGLNADENTKAIIINESLLEKLQIGNAQEAIGEKVTALREESIIVGVIKDFHFGTTENKIGPFFFLNGDDFERNRYYQANLKIRSDRTIDALVEVEKAWKEVDQVHQFNALFFDEEISRTYFFFKSMIEIMGFMALIAISIAILGLLGMVVFTTETRLKEISIRKILGASEGNLFLLLGKSFLILLTIAAIISIPLTYFTFDTYILKDYIYKESISALELIGGASIILIFGILIVLGQTLSATRTNPAELLRDE